MPLPDLTRAMRYTADLADAGPHKGEWIVVDRWSGSHVAGPFAARSETRAYADYLNAVAGQRSAP